MSYQSFFVIIEFLFIQVFYCYPDNIQKADSKRGTSRAPLAEMDKDEIDLSLQGAVGGNSRALPHCHGNSDQEDGKKEIFFKFLIFQNEIMFAVG